MTHLENWKRSATLRSEFAALLEEPAMKEAIECVKEAIFLPTRLPTTGLTPADRLALLGEMGMRKEMGLEFLHNFLGLAKISPLKENAQELQKHKAWKTTDEEAGKNKIREEFFGSPQAPTGSAEEPTLRSMLSPPPTPNPTPTPPTPVE
jgi:hypothetical protein